MPSTEKFYGVKLIDSITGKTYYTEIEVNHELTHTRRVQTLLPVDQQYPKHIYIGEPSYWSGRITAAFENNHDTECEDEYKFGDAAFRIEFVEWLHNRHKKIMYLSDKIIFPITILSEINVNPESNTITDNVVKTSFQWEQCGPRITPDTEVNNSG